MDIYKAGLTTAITQATGSVFVTPSSGPTAIPLPIALISTFNVTVNAHQLRASYVWVTACGPVDTASLSIFFGSSVSVTFSDMSLRVGVNGRWY
ncbi:hypothetical protein P5G63_19690 [Aeromonas salmonicida]|uniref:hypothetical protein n=1 Tax=Aeromonas salmonicida TaxID=645 RepID=UPI0022403012|nr:hypothetical protein [Aeromonas salmonicida]MDF8330587.1 hypothetical protein [Aeromonas salmonicida]